MINVGLIGFGYWGPNVARNFLSHKDCVLKRIADRSPERQKAAATIYPMVEVTDDMYRVTRAADIDVVAIATPVYTHHTLAMDALNNGKHVWIEKPITSTVQQAEEIIELATKKNLTVVVDHTFIFTGAVRKIKELVESGEVGDPYYYDSVRVNLGLFQPDINVIWDLAPHDLSIMDYVLGLKPTAVAAHGKAHFDTGLEDVAYLTLYFDNNMIANFHVNWLSPIKVRHTLLGGSKKMVVWDDLMNDESIKVYNRGVAVEAKEGIYEMMASYRMGDGFIPIVSKKEALAEEVSHFIHCIQNNQSPINDALSGLRVVQILEGSNLSLKQNGKLITI